MSSHEITSTDIGTSTEYDNQDELDFVSEKTVAQNIEKRGWLTKQGAGLKNWKRRFFILRNGELTYQASPKDTKPLNTIQLRGTFVRTAPEMKRDFCFMLFTPTRNFYMFADDQASMTEWMVALRITRVQIDAADAMAREEEDAPKDPVFSKEQARELLFLKLKTQSKETTAANDAYIERVIGECERDRAISLSELAYKKDIEATQKLAVVKAQHLEDLAAKDSLQCSLIREYESRIIDLEMMYNEKLSKVNCELEILKEKQEHSNAHASAADAKWITMVQTLLAEKYELQAKIDSALTAKQDSEVALEQARLEHQKEMAELRKTIIVMQSTLQQQALEHAKAMELLVIDIQSKHATEIAETCRIHEEKLASLKAEQRKLLAENGASLTTELARAIAEKDRELINISFSNENDSETGIRPTARDFYSGRALQEASQHISALVKKTLALEKDLADLELSKLELRSRATAQIDDLKAQLDCEQRRCKVLESRLANMSTPAESGEQNAVDNENVATPILSASQIIRSIKEKDDLDYSIFASQSQSVLSLINELRLANKEIERLHKTIAANEARLQKMRENLARVEVEKDHIRDQSALVHHLHYNLMIEQKSQEIEELKQQLREAEAKTSRMEAEKEHAVQEAKIRTETELRLQLEKEKAAMIEAQISEEHQRQLQSKPPVVASPLSTAASTPLSPSASDTTVVPQQQPQEELQQPGAATTPAAALSQEHKSD